MLSIGSLGYLVLYLLMKIVGVAGFVFFILGWVAIPVLWYKDIPLIGSGVGTLLISSFVMMILGALYM